MRFALRVTLFLGFFWLASLNPILALLALAAVAFGRDAVGSLEDRHL